MKTKQEFNDYEISLEDLSHCWEHPEIDNLDLQLAKCLSDPATSKNICWLKTMRSVLGLTAAGLAEKLNIKLSTIFYYEKCEKGQDISIQKMKAIAEAYDCRFVYGFVPKNHKSFAHMITAKVWPFIENPPFMRRAAKFQIYRVYGVRIAKFISRPTGWGQIWQLKKALTRRYNWIWLNIRKDEEFGH